MVDCKNTINPASPLYFVNQIQSCVLKSHQKTPLIRISGTSQRMSKIVSKCPLQHIVFSIFRKYSLYESSKDDSHLVCSVYHLLENPVGVERLQEIPLLIRRRKVKRHRLIIPLNPKPFVQTTNYINQQLRRNPL